MDQEPSVRPPGGVLEQRGRPSVEDRLADAAGPVVLAVVDALQRLDHLVRAAVVLRVLDDVLLARGVVDAAEGLLDVDRAHHDPGLPRGGGADSPTGAVTVGTWRPGRSSGCWPTRCGSRWWPPSRWAPGRSRTSPPPRTSRSRTSPWPPAGWPGPGWCTATGTRWRC